MSDQLFDSLDQVMAYVRGCHPVIAMSVLASMATSSDARSKERMDGVSSDLRKGPGLIGYDRAAQVGMILRALGDRLPDIYQLHLVAVYGTERESRAAIARITTYALDKIDHREPRKMVYHVVRRFYGHDVRIARVAASVYQGDEKKVRYRGYHVSAKVGAILVSLMASAESMATSILKDMGVL